MSDPLCVDAIARAGAESPFLTLLLTRQADVAAALAEGRIELSVGFDTALPIARRLRDARQCLALNVAIGDLAGLLDLGEVTNALTRFADAALDAAITAAIAERTPGVQPRGFAAIALGKQGSFELNYSSDIDPIFLFDPDVLPRRRGEEPVDAAVRIGRRVVELLQARDQSGYVLRVDLRLRPSPEATPIALPVGAAIGYYESQALPWERAAFIRARAAAGDIALGERFLDAIRPFVWRRGLEFGAAEEVRSISARIRDHYAKGQAFGPGYDLKRGRGGIREVEFHAQILQLIHGGRDPTLRAPATVDALARLAEAGWLDSADAAMLRDGYVMLRTIEHRVQMVDDRQTHTLPAGPALDSLARLHGLRDGEALLSMLAPRVAGIGRLYDAFDAPVRSVIPQERAALHHALAAAGFDEPEAAAQRLEAWRSGRYRALRSPAAQTALEAMLPTLLSAIGVSAHPGPALLAADRLLERLPSAINLFRLLEARPALAELLVAILAHAPPLAEALAARPALLDGLVDASAFAPMPTVPTLAAEMRRVEPGTDYQHLLNRVRAVVGEKRFALGAQIVAGAADPLSVAIGYADVAEACVEVLATAAIDEFARVHGHVPGGELVILSLGRFGGGVLTHASDLDIVYLFTGDFRASSDGDKPLGGTLYYNRLAQRITAALSVPTAAGPLYAVDTRLRPSGTQGPLAVSLDSFERYQRGDAWTWEHMALTRARPIFGSASARAAVSGAVERLLATHWPRDIIADARSMRADIATHKPPRGELDVKLLPGGLVDCEFAVQVTQLCHHAGFDTRLDRAIDALAAAGWMRPEIRAAHDTLTRLLVATRLLAPDGAVPPEPTRPLLARALGVETWAGVVARIDAARQVIGECWDEVQHGTG